MTDDEIRTLVAGARRSMVKHPPGTVAVLRQALADSAGEDFPEVERWIIDQAGELQIAPAIPSQGLRPGRVMAKSAGPFPYYVLPETALQAD